MDAFVTAVAGDWRAAGLLEADRALCAFAEKLTLKPTSMEESDVIRLRDFGFADRAIHDAVQVIAYFNYINRVADALDVDLETEVKAWESSGGGR